MKNKYRLVTLVVFTLLTISLFSIKNNRHYTLLQKETECWGVQDTGYGTIYNYDYSELGGNLVMSELGIQNWESVYFTIFYDPEYHYVVQYEMSTGNDGNTYVYTVLDSAQAIAFRYTYTINNQNKLAFYQYWKNGNYSYSTTKRLFYNPSGVLDSIFYSSHSYPNRSHYIKNIFAHDSLDRITTIQKFNSTDSLNWNPSYLRTVYYGIPLPFELHLNIPETSDSDPFEYLYCPDYRVDSLVTHYINDNYYVTESYSYSLSNNVLTIMFPEYIGEKVLQFNASGYLITNSNPGYPNSSGTYYTWGEYVVSNEDDYITPEKLSIYPNPFKNKLIINTKDNSFENISIYNIKGQLIRAWKDVKTNELTWDGKDASNHSISSGIYLIKARQGKDITTSKVLKY